MKKISRWPYCRAILSAMMLITFAVQDTIDFERSEVIGYTSMVLAFLLIHVGVRTYRDNAEGGAIGFGRAFKVGALIAVVASLCYVATWQVVYYRLAPDFMTQYEAHILEKARENGETETQIAKRKAEMDKYAAYYQNPAINAGITFLEPLPVALIIALVSAGVLSRRKAQHGSSRAVMTS